MAAEEERRASAAAAEEEVVYKTKVVQFLGRSTPIILQNDNGPCPLLAICNVLLLRNYINLSLDASEVPLQKLLSLVAERLIDSNSNVQDKGDEYVSNQQQNIADAIDLLPRLATGIDVNLHFRKINDFEFTRECAIFDLLDIGLCHGWIVDPQDSDTTAAIGSKSYNTLVAELVAFETRKSEGERNQSIPEEDFVDFAAATTATLGVPSPSLSRVLSFDESPVSVTVGQKERRGDREEAEELTRALHLSATELCSSVDVSLTPEAVLPTSPNLDGSAHTRSFESTTQNVDLLSHIGDESEKPQKADQSSPPADGSSINYDADSLLTNVLLAENCSSSATAASARISDRLVAEGSGDDLDSNNLLPVVKTDLFIQKQLPSSEYIDRDESDVCSTSRDQTPVERTIPSQTSSDDIFLSTTDPKPTDDLPDFDLGISSHPSAPCADLNSSKEKQESVDVSDVCSSLEGSEPIYEGEECIIDSQLKNYEDREPVYEGEAVLAEQMDKTDPSSPGHSKDDDDKDQWKLIKNFLENNASQLTIYGLFCLQEGLKERELCVFFRNNHFSTMFKFNGELYLLATDQGYINQPDLVWEKLNEVNGDSVFMTGNFREFKAENHLNDSWNEQNAINSTAEYISSLGGSNPANSTLKSDLELAIALQQQEFEQQPQRQQVQNPQPSYVGGRSKLVTGPQASKNSHSSQKSESKKDKCIVM